MQDICFTIYLALAYILIVMPPSLCLSFLCSFIPYHLFLSKSLFDLSIVVSVFKNVSLIWRIKFSDFLL